MHSPSRVTCSRISNHATPGCKQTTLGIIINQINTGAVPTVSFSPALLVNNMRTILVDNAGLEHRDLYMMKPLKRYHDKLPTLFHVPLYLTELIVRNATDHSRWTFNWLMMHHCYDTYSLSQVTCSGGRTRTADIMIKPSKNHTLYQLSYTEEPIIYQLSFSTALRLDAGLSTSPITIP